LDRAIGKSRTQQLFPEITAKTNPVTTNLTCFVFDDKAIWNHKIVIYRIGYFLYQFGIIFSQKCLLNLIDRITNVVSQELLLSYYSGSSLEKLTLQPKNKLFLYFVVKVCRAFFKDFPVGGGIFWKGTFLWDNILEGDSNGWRPRVRPIYHAWMGGGSLGEYSPRKFLKFESRECHFLHSEHPNLLPNIC
jgi:hypothetical protein